MRRLPLLVLPLLLAAALAAPARAEQTTLSTAALPATGPHPAVLTVGLLLVAGGIGLRSAMRYQGRHAASPVWLTRLLDRWPAAGSHPPGGRHAPAPVPSRSQRT